MSDYRDLNWELFTGHMFSKKELDEIYQQGRADAIEECIKKLYEVTPKTAEQKLDMVFVNELRKMKGKWNVKN